MSYDLRFYKKDSNPISKTEIADCLSALPNTTVNDKQNQWVYQNSDTEVYCIFELHTSEDEDVEQYDGFTDTGFTFYLNFIRPQFFGKESFALVDKLITELDLFVLNYQAGSEPQQYTVGELEKHWAKLNLDYAKSKFSEFELSYLELNKSNAAWQYCFHKKSLEAELGKDNYFVPKIIYVKKHDSIEVETLCVWPEHIPCVLPKVDWVMIRQKHKKSFFRSKSVEGLIKYTTIMDALGEYFDDKTDAGGNYKIIHPDKAAQIGEQFNALPIASTFAEFGLWVSVEQFVNIQ